jgi:putative Holliday junction resolvase
MRYLGIDWGEKRIGLAIGDSENKTAVPFKVVGSIEDIEHIVKEEEIKMIILGKPLKMKTIKTRLHNGFTTFFEILQKKISIPIETVDERLSSKAADVLPGSKTDKAPRDAVAAMLILQSYLDQL